MKQVISIIIVFTSILGFSQKRTNIFFRDFVECYYPQTVSDSINIFDKINGNNTAKLPPLENKHCYYKFAISDSKNGWLKIENILVGPGCGKNDLNTDINKYKGKWVLAKNMTINVGVSHNIKIGCLVDKTVKGFAEVGAKFYIEPNLKSTIAFCVGGYVETELIEVNGTWAKLKLIHKGKTYIGWLQNKYQCAYPWTTCPVYD